MKRARTRGEWRTTEDGRRVWYVIVLAEDS